MFWDICPISILNDSQDKKDLEASLFQVFENTLTLKHGPVSSPRCMD